MLNLIKLELKKFKIKDNLKGVVIANIVLIALLTTLVLASKFDNSNDISEITEFSFYISITETMVKATFIIFAAVLLGRLTAGEYKNKTINIMFMYPINRKKLFIAKLIIVYVFTFINILFSNALLILLFGLIDGIVDIMPGTLTAELFLDSYVMVLINSVIASFIALIPFYFGMRKKSTTHTIVSSIIIIVPLCQNSAGFSLGSFLPVTIVVGIFGLIITMVTLRNIENADVL